jgi:uncharacterized protein
MESAEFVQVYDERLAPNSTVSERDLARLIHHIVSFIADEPRSVNVSVDGREVDGVRCTMYTIRTAPDDAGKVIGKQGRLIASLREVVRAAAFTRGIKITIEVVDHKGGRSSKIEPDATSYC